MPEREPRVIEIINPHEKAEALKKEKILLAVEALGEGAREAEYSGDEETAEFFRAKIKLLEDKE